MSVLSYRKEKVIIMKKLYSKPILYYENFALLDAIAGCDFISNQNRDSCVGYQLPGSVDVVIFSSAMEGCNHFSQKDDSVCYGIPTSGNAIWSS